MRESVFENLAGRSVFVTGHTGFKGSWLSLWLSALGARVTGYALAAPTVPSHFELAEVRGALAAHYDADLRDRAALAAAIRAAEPELVIHMAAQSVVRTGYAEPSATYDTNVMGTASLLDAVRDAGSPCVVIVVTTDKVYENREHVWGYRENDPLGGYDPYSASKAACDILTASYRRSYFPADRLADHGVKLAVVRAGNVIGGGDFKPHALVPDLVRALHERRPLAVRSPRSVRPWQHVLDCLDGYLTLADRMLGCDDPGWCDAWNFGPMLGNELQVRDVVTSMSDLWLADEQPAEESWVDASDPMQPHEAGVLRLAIDKAMWGLGWRPKWDVDQAIGQTVAWYRAWSLGEPVAEISRAQIQRYITGHRPELLIKEG